MIELCPFCHAKAHGDARFSRDLKHDCQLEWLETHTLDEWMELMGKSWIDEQELTALRVGIEPKSGADIFDD